MSIDDVDAAASTKGNGHPWPVGRLRRGRAWRLRSAAEWMKGSYLCGNNATTGASAQAGAGISRPQRNGAWAQCSGGRFMPCPARGSRGESAA